MIKEKLMHRSLIAGFGLVLASAVGLFGCSGQPSETGAPEAPVQNAPSEQAETSEYPAIDMAAMDFDYSARDLDPSYDASSATRIQLMGSSATVEGQGAQANGSAVTVSQAGTYVVSGSLEDGQLVVDATAEDKVQLVLDGVSIHNEDGPAILINQADKCFITLVDNSQNKLSDGSNYTLEEGEDEPNAVVYSKDDLTINGSGALEVTASYRHAINSKDDLVITGGNYEVSSVEDALRGKDCVKIKDGSFQIEAGEDAIKSNNDAECDRGFVCIDGGTFSIAAGDDAIHAETVLNVNDGTIDISTCEEGFEAEQLYVNGSTTHITSNDDALNAAARGVSSSEMMPGRGGDMGPQGAGTQTGNTCLLQINGGYLVLDAQGDGLDSNGTFEMNGGVVLLSGPTNQGNGSIDFDGQGILTGGTLLAVGPTGMAQGFNELQQPFVSANVSGQAGQSVAVVDDQGKVIVSFTPAKSFQLVQTSTTNMQNGATYSIVVGGSVAGANADGYATDGSVSGGTSTSATASTEAQQMGRGGGMGPQGKMGAPGEDMQGEAGPEGSAPSGGGRGGKRG